MNGMTKFLIGAGATALMAMASHGALGLGDRFVTGLETRAQTVLNGMAAGDAGGVTAQAVRDTSIDRIILLSGIPPGGPDARADHGRCRRHPGCKAGAVD